MCHVCGSMEAEPHFGGISCRACAAFFRRYYRSGRISSKCTCKRRELHSHPCGKCRMERCLRVGMSPKKVQVCRDKHCARVPKPSTSTQILPSLLMARILPKNILNWSNWHEFESKRDQINGGKIESMNFYEASCTVKTDIDLIWRMLHPTFNGPWKIGDSDPGKLCGQRDPNGASMRTLDQGNWSSMAASSSCMPMMPYLPPKDVTNITSTLPNFSIFESKRIQMFQNLGLQNVFAITSLTKHDLNLTSELVGEVFPDFQKLSNNDKNSLVSSFFLKLRQIQPALDHVSRRVEYQRMEEEDVRIRMMEFFDGSFLEGEEMRQEDIWRIFGPHWTYFFERVIEPIIALQLDQIEFMAIVWILFFDPAYINMSQKGADLCWTIRKVIHRELKNYIFEKIDNSEFAENRFFEILQVPLIVEHGEQKFLDEFIICELNRIRIHDDFKAIVRKQRI